MVDIFLGSLVQLSVGMEEGCKQILLASVGSARSVSATLGSPRSRRVCFPCQHCLGSRLLCRELSEDGPELYALPSSKPLRFRYWGIPQRHRLGWTCILYPSQVRAAQVTRCLVSMVALTCRLLIPAAWFSGCTTGTTFSVGCRPSRIPRILG